MATLCLPHSELHVGLSVADSPSLAAELSNPARPPVLLYPGEGAIDIAQNPPRGPVTLVVVDGTWSQAKKIVKRDPALARLPRYAFTPAQPSEYRIRREPSAECVSTIEALMQVLGVLERDPHRFQALLVPFRAMVGAQLEHARLQSPRHKKRPRQAPPPHPVPPLLRERMNDVVCIAGEANAWPYHAPEREQFPEELVQWTALRIATGETFDVVVAPRSPLAPGTSRWVEIGPDVIARGESLESLAAKWSRFVREQDVLVTWGRYAAKIFVAGGGTLVGARFDMRQVARAWSRGRVGTMEEFIASHPPATALSPVARGRAGRRIAQLAYVTQVVAGS